MERATMSPDIYKLEGEFSGVKVYTALDPSDKVHLSRYVAAQRQEIYDKGGATPEVLERTADALLDAVNKSLNPDKFRSEVAVLAHSIKYRLKHPLDDHNKLRIGFILSYLEGEPIVGVNDYWMDKKWELVRENPEAYAFFLSWGIVNSKEYESHLITLKEQDYFQKRKDAILSIGGLI